MKETFWDYVMMGFYHLSVHDVGYQEQPLYWKNRCACIRLLELKLEMTGCLDSGLL